MLPSKYKDELQRQTPVCTTTTFIQDTACARSGTIAPARSSASPAIERRRYASGSSHPYLDARQDMLRIRRATHAESTMAVPYTNWSGAFTFTAPEARSPASLDELRRMVADAERIHAVGSRHCFNGIADSAVIVSLANLPMPVEIDRDAMTVTINPGMRYAELLVALEAEGLAIHNTASLPHITVGGAVATATHGSGDNLGNLATAVSAMELITADGDIVRSRRGDADFPGLVVHVGALGIVPRITLDLQPSYRMRQEVFLDLDWDVLYAQFDEIMSCGDSVSLFCDYGPTVNELWVKTRVAEDDAWQPRPELFGARAATEQTHPVPRFDGTVCTDQLGAVGA